ACAPAVATNITSQPGDMLVSETAAPFWGYNAELERGMVVGEPSDEQRELHRHTVEAQQAALDDFPTAKTCADVDTAVLAYLDDNGIRDLWRQHTGHGIGLRNHEAPFLDECDHTALAPARGFTD